MSQVSIENQITVDLKEAMKNKKVLEKGVLILLKSGLTNLKKNERLDVLTHEQEIAVVQKELKQTRDALDGAKASKREDLIAKEEEKIAIITRFLPKQLSKEEIEVELKKAGITSGMNMGEAMKIAKPALAGKAENKLVSMVVKEMITA